MGRTLRPGARRARGAGFPGAERNVGEDPYAAWAREVARLREAEENRRRRVRVSVAVKDGVEPLVIRRGGDAGGSLGDALAALLAEDGLGKAIHRGPDWRAWWRAAAGSEIAAAAEPVSFRNGFLTVAVRSAPLRMELETFHAAALLETLRNLAGGETVVRGLKFKSVGRSAGRKG